MPVNKNNKPNKKPIDKKTSSIPSPMSRKTKPSLNIEGVGDLVKLITNSLGFETCEKCEERRLKLNQMFSFLKTVKRNLTDDEIEFINQINEKKIIFDMNKFIKIYNEVFGVRVTPCNCPNLHQQFLIKLNKQIELQQIK